MKRSHRITTLAAAVAWLGALALAGGGCSSRSDRIVAPAQVGSSVAPVLTVFGPTFSRTQALGGVSLDPAQLVSVERPAGEVVVFNWSARPGSAGAAIAGYRWAMDLAAGGVDDATPRANAGDLAHWSAWSLTENHVAVGPFDGSAAQGHVLWVEAKDAGGQLSLLRVNLKVIPRTATRSLLLVDDMWGTPTERSATPPYVTFKNPYPMEAEQDSFYNAVGGVPDSMRILGGVPGAVSVAGSFASFSYDTLDYHTAWPEEGISLATLARYRVVAWYTDQTSSANSGAKFGSNRPSTAIRFMNSVGQQNTLADYLRLGGKAWLFGDGITTAIANGYGSRLGAGLPRFPYTSGSDPATDILVPGDFLYDFVHLRSEVNVADLGGSALTRKFGLHACLPYLPQFALPAGQPVPADRSLDPRVGPSAARRAVRWGGLPRLTLAAYRSANVDPAQRTFSKTMVITQPLSIVEGHGHNVASTLDTLYLAQALEYDPDDASVGSSDGRPNAIDYHGRDNGELVWFGFPLYVFEPDQARAVTTLVLTNLGVPRAAPGTAGAHPAAPQASFIYP